MKRFCKTVWLLAEVIAAGNKTNHALQSLEHHADLLAVVYGIAAGRLVFGGVLGGWIVFGRLDAIKTDVIQVVQPQLDSMRRDTDENRLTGVANEMRKRFDDLDKEASCINLGSFQNFLKSGSVRDLLLYFKFK